MKVKMNDTTRAGGLSLAGGSVVEVDDATGKHLVESGLATESSAAVTEQQPGTRTQAQADILKGQLEIAKAHGDVDAALRLDRVQRGEEDLTREPEPTPEPNPNPNPEPEPVPTPRGETTGASARRTLTR